MGRSPCCCHEGGVKKGPWTEEEDSTLVEHIRRHGGRVGSWRGLPKAAGLNRCGKSCRLRWNNYLRPDIKRGNFTDDEERLIISLHSVLGNKWSTIATHLEGRTDNEIKNYWNTHIRKKLLRMGVDPVTHQQLPPDLDASPAVLPEALLWAAAAAGLGGLDSDLRQVQLLQQLLQAVVGSSNNDVGASRLITNLAAANAMFNPTASISIMPNLQDQLMNIQSPANYQLPDYLRRISSFPEQDIVQQLINTTSPAVSSCPAAAPTDQHRGSAAAFVPAACQHDVAAAPVDRPAVQEFPSLEPMEVPDLCSMESDSFWNDILEDSYRF